jgi:hypothetical protein
MAHGLESTVLDKDFLDVAMRIDPEESSLKRMMVQKIHIEKSV